MKDRQTEVLGLRLDVFILSERGYSVQPSPTAFRHRETFQEIMSDGIPTACTTIEEVRCTIIKQDFAACQGRQFREFWEIFGKVESKMLQLPKEEHSGCYE